MSKTILYIGNFSFPKGNASGKRVLGNGLLFRKLGYDVVYIGLDNELVGSETVESTEQEYLGFNYYNLPYPKGNLDWLKFHSVANKIIQFIENSKCRVDKVIFYGSPTISLFMTKLIRYCRNKNIMTFSDCVDWLAPNGSSFVFNSVKWLDTTYQKRYANKKVDGVICISSYLAKYYQKSGLKTVIIPPLTEKIVTKENKVNKNKDCKVITYAGQLFRKGMKDVDCTKLKDRIDKTVELLHQVKSSGVKFTFNIYGFTKEDYFLAIPQHVEVIKELENSILFHGAVSNEEVQNAVSLSDFTILIRDVKRDTMAGFPTKVSESMGLGTPVITTKTSDLERYIKDGENGFFIDLSKGQDQLIKILNMPSEDLSNISSNCFKNSVLSVDHFFCENEPKLQEFYSRFETS